MGQYRIAHNNSIPPRPNYWVCPGTHLSPTVLCTTWYMGWPEIPAPHVTRFVVRSEELLNSKRGRSLVINYQQDQKVITENVYIQSMHIYFEFGETNYIFMNSYYQVYIFWFTHLKPTNISFPTIKKNIPTKKRVTYSYFQFGETFNPHHYH